MRLPICMRAGLERNIHVIEMRCYQRILIITCKDHVTYEEVYNRIQDAIRNHDDLLTAEEIRCVFDDI